MTKQEGDAHSLCKRSVSSIVDTNNCGYPLEREKGGNEDMFTNSAGANDIRAACKTSVLQGFVPPRVAEA